MASQIQRLDSLTIDKIAAGEVVDIPASCVKELVDNALDAGATDIVVEVQLGGRELIRVTDNGCGMSKEDLSLSVERHSTSKLRTVEDFEHITSLGFRGEALAAIVAVSHMTIRSAQDNKSSSLCPGAVLVAKGGEIESISESQALPGTCVEVRSLFYNVPARRKFLKSPSRDTQEIVKTVTNIALAIPHVSFRLVADGKQLLSLEKEQNVESRIRTLLKEPFQTDSLQIVKSFDGVEIQGLIVSPTHTRSTRSGQHVLVNSRHVYSLPISCAVRSGFGTACENSRHPLFVLQLTLDPACVDVNIHPQKREVRFSDEEWIKRLVQEAVQEALFGYVGGVEISPPFAYSKPNVSAGEENYEPFFREDPNLHQEELSFTAPKKMKKCLAIVDDLALIDEADGNLLILDLKRAMRAVVAFDLKSEKISSEPLLLPISLNFSPDEAHLLRETLSNFEQIGITIRSFGPQNFLVEALPSGVFEIDMHKLVLEILHEEIFALKRSRDQFYKRYSALYVAAMKELSSPISSQIAFTVYEQWKARGAPPFSPDGSVCMGHLTKGVLQDLVSKGSFLSKEKGK
jgi:DNA mismatch repair protein MutL